MLQMIAWSYPPKTIANYFKISLQGYYWHLADIQRRLNVHGRGALTAFAIRWGVLHHGKFTC